MSASAGGPAPPETADAGAVHRGGVPRDRGVLPPVAAARLGLPRRLAVDRHSVAGRAGTRRPVRDGLPGGERRATVPPEPEPGEGLVAPGFGCRVGRGGAARPRHGYRSSLPPERAAQGERSAGGESGERRLPHLREAQAPGPPWAPQLVLPQRPAAAGLRGVGLRVLTVRPGEGASHHGRPSAGATAPRPGAPRRGTHRRPRSAGRLRLPARPVGDPALAATRRGARGAPAL